MVKIKLYFVKKLIDWFLLDKKKGHHRGKRSVIGRRREDLIGSCSTNIYFLPLFSAWVGQEPIISKLRKFVDARHSSHVAILWGFDAKIVFGAKQVGNIQIPDFTLSVGQKNQIDFLLLKSSLRWQVGQKKIIGTVLGSKNDTLGSLVSSNWSLGTPR